jgi:hypothetical protein
VEKKKKKININHAKEGISNKLADSYGEVPIPHLRHHSGIVLSSSDEDIHTSCPLLSCLSWSS